MTQKNRALAGWFGLACGQQPPALGPEPSYVQRPLHIAELNAWVLLTPFSALIQLQWTCANGSKSVPTLQIGHRAQDARLADASVSPTLQSPQLHTKMIAGHQGGT